MRLNCNLQPRADGKLRAVGKSGKQYTFAVDDGGNLAADVDDNDAVGFLLIADERFEPADEADYARADGMLEAARPKLVEDDDEDDDAEPNMDVLPVEANTPPKPPKQGKAKRAA